MRHDTTSTTHQVLIMLTVWYSHFSSVTPGCLRSVLLARRRSALKCCDYTSCFPAFQHNWHAMQLCSLQPRFKGASQSVFDLVLYFCVNALLSTQTDARFTFPYQLSPKDAFETIWVITWLEIIEQTSGQSDVTCLIIWRISQSVFIFVQLCIYSAF